MGKGDDKITVGYRYYWDLFSGLGRGPINSIVAILADKKVVHISQKDELSSSSSIYINKPNLFGGDDTGGEGGIQGWLDIYMGEQTQVPSNKLKKLLTGLVPGFRGIVTTLFSGLISCYSASPKPWVYRVRRTDKGWDNNQVWYPDKCTILLRDDISDVGNFTDEAALRYPMPTKPVRNNQMTEKEWQQIIKPYLKKVEEIEKQRADYCKALEDNVRNIHAMNPAHILYESATNRDWGRGLNTDDIDVDSFKLAADKLYEEQFGLCFRYNRQDQLNTFIQQILDHIGAAQYADLSTGKLKLKLIRDDYNADELPLFTYDNGILSVQDHDSASIDAAPNEVSVTYHNPVINEDAEVRAQNLASIQAVGIISSAVNYKALPIYELAARVAQRDLETGVAGITRLTLKFDRRGGILEPVSCFRVSLPDRDIENMVLRVGKIEEQDDGSFLITAIQDVFGLPSTSYTSNNQSNEWREPDKSIYVVDDVKLIEMPYALLASKLSTAELNYLEESTGFLGVMASAPTPLSINYKLQSRTAGSSFVTQKQGDWTPTGLLKSDISKLTTCFAIESDSLPAIGDGILVDDEMMRVDEVDVATKTLTVGRGCFDTLPSFHKSNAKLRFYTDGAIEWLKNEYMSGEQVDVKLLTQTSIGILNESLAPIVSQTMAHRQIRPYLPGKIAVNGTLYPDSIETAKDYQLTFAHRDRLLQADRLIDCLSENIGPETNTVYKIEIRDSSTDEIIWHTTTTDIFIDLPYLSDDNVSNKAHYLTLYSVRDDYTSFNRFKTALPEGRVVISDSENDNGGGNDTKSE